MIFHLPNKAIINSSGPKLLLYKTLKKIIVTRPTAKTSTLSIVLKALVAFIMTPKVIRAKASMSKGMDMNISIRIRDSVSWGKKWGRGRVDCSYHIPIICD